MLPQSTARTLSPTQPSTSQGLELESVRSNSELPKFRRPGKSTNTWVTRELLVSIALTVCTFMLAGGPARSKLASTWTPQTQTALRYKQHSPPLNIGNIVPHRAQPGGNHGGQTQLPARSRAVPRAAPAWHVEEVDNWIAARRLVSGVESGQDIRAKTMQYLTKPGPNRSLRTPFLGAPSQHNTLAWPPCCNVNATDAHTSCTSRSWTSKRATVEYEYRRIYKSGNDNICKLLKTDLLVKPPGAGRSFTMIRSPLSHFISGYSEVVWRNSEVQLQQLTPQDKQELVGPPARFRTLDNPRDKAIAFIQDLLSCKLTRFGATALEHIFPQVTFLHWAYIDDFYHISSLAKFENASFHAHPETDASSGNQDRRAMEILMREDKYMCAVARIVAQDYACFGFPFPEACGKLPVRCPPVGISSHQPINWMKSP
eukprot:m.221035 g.221035  ORF g.221035 m.221035 type:complete len:428 (+) comp15606_c0_seq6:71-1354(+)